MYPEANMEPPLRRTLLADVRDILEQNPNEQGFRPLFQSLFQLIKEGKDNDIFHPISWRLFLNVVKTSIANLFEGYRASRTNNQLRDLAVSDEVRRHLADLARYLDQVKIIWNLLIVQEDMLPLYFSYNRVHDFYRGLCAEFCNLLRRVERRLKLENTVVPDYEAELNPIVEVEKKVDEAILARLGKALEVDNVKGVVPERVMNEVTRLIRLVTVLEQCSKVPPQGHHVPPIVSIAVKLLAWLEHNASNRAYRIAIAEEPWRLDGWALDSICQDHPSPVDGSIVVRYQGVKAILKFYEIKSPKSVSEVTKFQLNVRSMSTFTHKNLLQCLGGCDSTQPCWFMVPMFKTTLRQYIVDQGIALSLDAKLLLAIGIASGVEAMHQLDVSHLSLNIDTVVMDDYNQPLVSLIPFNPSTQNANQYQAPERLRGKVGTSKPSNIFSLSVILIEIFFGGGNPIWFGADPKVPLDEDEIKSRILKGECPTIVSEDGKKTDLFEIFRKCQCMEPRSRITASEVVTRLDAVLAALPIPPTPRIITGERQPSTQPQATQRMRPTSTPAYPTPDPSLMTMLESADIDQYLEAAQDILKLHEYSIHEEVWKVSADIYEHHSNGQKKQTTRELVELMIHYGWILFLGLGRPKDQEAAFAIWAKAWNRTNPSKGPGPGPSRDELSDLFKVATYLRMIYFSTKGKTHDVDWPTYFKIESQFHGFNGEEHPTYSRHLKWCALGTQNEALCTYMLARCYLEGIGVERNLAKAHELFQATLTSAGSLSSYCLGNLEYEGHFGKPNLKAALTYFKMFDDPTNPNCAFMTAKCYQELGTGRPDLITMLYKEAARLGHPQAKEMYPERQKRRGNTKTRLMHKKRRSDLEESL
ncbi:uncharacterized protein BJ171DRAFT_605420 [Polychytrium aggregatum]|uniref:uncharacterized protein n=1 Tax=Polychytrium aggregatum TaxID=110093 RepID=UPI0022FEFDBD|nr:uncharacterized protein BJ171DRAFT_605420 [Polychytrium aggregatum]KAI9193007.1 hypothetical protein BJ171DRAFT_605420 [Polychytrium aggregatum]